MPQDLIKSEVQIIASSEYNFKVELILEIGKEDVPDLIETSKGLVDIFGDRALLNENNINKYFSKDTLPFVARYKGTIIGYIIGVPLEHFSQESWSHFDSNLNKKKSCLFVPIRNGLFCINYKAYNHARYLIYY